MTTAKWLSVVVCACLLLSPQLKVNAIRLGQEGQPPAGLDRMRQLITDPADFNSLHGPSVEKPTIAPQQVTGTPPAWDKVAFQSYRYNMWDIYLADSTGGNEIRLTNDSKSNVYPSLARGGSLVAFASNRSGNYDIYVENANRTGLKTLASSSATDTYPVFSPDGSRIAFQSYRTGDYELYAMNSDGSGLVQLTHSSAYDGEATWSPDGSQIAFVSSRSGMYEIWVMNADGSNPHQLTSYSTTATPAWSPRGDKIVYANDRNMDSYYELWWMDADGSNPAVLRNYTSGYEQNDDWAPSWSPDGKFFTFIETEWRMGPQYGWTGSYTYSFNPYDSSDYYGVIANDSLTLRFNQASTDITPPGPCSIGLASVQSANSFRLNWLALDSESGTAFYDVQYRNLSGGVWTDFLKATNQTAGMFTGKDGERFEFRCRAVDLSRNLGDWGPPPYAATEINANRPASITVVSQRYVNGTQAEVVWAGKVSSGLPLTYDLFVRDGAHGDWTPWLEGTHANSTVFTGIPGHTYYFRSQARDTLGHTQVWQPDAQAAVTFYNTILSVQAVDPRGNPLGAPTVSLLPAAQVDVTGQEFRTRRLGVNPGSLKISAAPAGFGALPNTTLNISADRQFTFIMPPADNVLINGGFETGNLNGWSPSGDGITSTTEEYHTGQYAVKIAPGPGGSELSRAVFIPAALHQPTLSFLYKLPSNPDGDTLTVEVEGDTLQTVLSTSAVVSGWTHGWADLSSFAGQSVTLRFRISGSSSETYLDEISLGSWQNPALQSVAPVQWQASQSQTITISGQNFSGTPQLFLNNIPLKNVNLQNSGQLTAETPAGMPGGAYTLRMIATQGIEAVLPDPLLLSPLLVYVPMVASVGAPVLPGAPDPAPNSDWLTLGNDEQHSSLVADEAGASRYSPVWTVLPLGYTYNMKVDQVVSADGVIIVSQEYNKTLAGLFAYDASSGRLLWYYTFPVDDTKTYNPAVISNGMVYFLMGPTFCFDLHTGQVLWQSIMNSKGDNHPLVVGQKIYFRGYDIIGQYTNGQTALSIGNAANGTQGISFGFDSDRSIWSPAYTDGKIYTWVNGIFNEQDPDTGKVIWNLASAWNQPPSYAVPVISNRTALVTSQSDLLAIDLDLHQVRWSVPGSYSANLPAVAGDVVYAINGSVLEARQVSNGALLSSFTAPAALLHSPVISGAHVLVSSANTTYLLDRTTLQPLWTAPEGGWLTLANGYLVIARSDGSVSVYRSEER